jgi:hypothetical protein
MHQSIQFRASKRVVDSISLPFTDQSSMEGCVGTGLFPHMSPVPYIIQADRPRVPLFSLVLRFVEPPANKYWIQKSQFEPFEALRVLNIIDVNHI